LLRSKGCKVY